MKNITSLLSLFLFFGFISCKGNSEEESKVFNALEQGFENSNEVISNSNNHIYKKLDYDSKDPITRFKAEIWNGKALLVKMYCDSAINYIENTKKKELNYSLDEKMILVLYGTIKSLKNNLMKIDLEIKTQFEKSVSINNISGENIEDSVDEFKNYFAKKSKAEQNCLLSKIKNNIKISENKIITFCSYKYTTHMPWFDSFSYLLGQNADILKGGSELIVTAGIGAFSTKAVPKIVINNKFIETVNGVATYKMKTPTKPGKYKLPITINSIDESGNKLNETRTIEYEVSELK